MPTVWQPCSDSLLKNAHAWRLSDRESVTRPDLFSPNESLARVIRACTVHGASVQAVFHPLANS